jgi:hypothetical protein
VCIWIAIVRVRVRVSVSVSVRVSVSVSVSVRVRVRRPARVCVGMAVIVDILKPLKNLPLLHG